MSNTLSSRAKSAISHRLVRILLSIFLPVTAFGILLITEGKDPIATYGVISQQQSRNESEVIELGNYYEVGNGRCVVLHSRQHCCNRYGEVMAASPSLRAWRG